MNNCQTLCSRWEGLCGFSLKKVAGTALAVGLLAALGGWQYYSRIWLSQAATTALSELQDRLSDEKLASLSESQTLRYLNEIDQAVKKYDNSGMKTYFMVLKARVLLAADRKPEALAVLRELNSLSGNDLISDLYRVKAAVMSVSSQEADLIGQGLADLEALSLNSQEPAVKMLALFRLFQHYWVTKDMIKARDCGARFLLQYRNADKNPFGNQGLSQNDMLDQVKFYMGLITVNQ